MIVSGFVAGPVGMPASITLDTVSDTHGRLLACSDGSRPSGQVIALSEVYATANACVVAQLRLWAIEASAAIESLSFVVIGSSHHELFVAKCSSIVRLMKLALIEGYITMDDVAAAIRPTPRGDRVLAHIGMPTEIGADLT